MVEEASACSIGIPQASEREIADRRESARAGHWVTKNREALETSNAFVESRGLPLAGERQF